MKRVLAVALLQISLSVAIPGEVGVIWNQRARRERGGAGLQTRHTHTHTNSHTHAQVHYTQTHGIHTLLTQGLSKEQEAWLESVTHQKISTSWPLLTSNQSANLLRNVRTSQSLPTTLITRLVYTPFSLRLCYICMCIIITPAPFIQ